MAKNSNLTELRRRLDREPDSRIFALLAEELRQNGELEEAIRVARDGLSRHPDYTSARISLGRALLDSGDAPSARAEFETVLRDHPDNFLANRLLGESLAALEATGSAFTYARDGQRMESLDDYSRGPIRLVDQQLGAVAPGSGEPPAPSAASPVRPAYPPASVPALTPGAPQPADRPGAAVPDPGTRDARRPAEPQYIDFADEGVVAPAKVAPMLESLRDPDSVVGEALRLLASRVQNLRRDRGIGCLAVTSALPGDGKSAVALGLAGALAREEGQRVLLVEADLRRPSVTRTLGLPPAPGLSEWLKGDLENVPLRVLQPGGFSLLTAGEIGLERPELLKSARMDALLRAARSLFEFVLLDAVPILPVTDTVLIQDLIDGFLVVARSRQTPRDALQEALSQLRPDKVLGVALNDHEEYRDAYRTYAYQRYGMSDRTRYGRVRGSSSRKRKR